MTILSNLCACLLHGTSPWTTYLHTMDPPTVLYAFWPFDIFTIIHIPQKVTPKCLTPFIHNHEICILSFQLSGLSPQGRLPSILIPGSLVSSQQKEKYLGRLCGANIWKQQGKNQEHLESGSNELRFWRPREIINLARAPYTWAWFISQLLHRSVKRFWEEVYCD
jgi:hypothetical protein